MGFGTYLFHPLGQVPPLVATAPIRALRKKIVRATCHPPSLPALALRHVCVASCVPAPATIFATSSITAASMPDSAAAKSNV